jgi:hypothetical protein
MKDSEKSVVKMIYVPEEAIQRYCDNVVAKMEEREKVFRNMAKAVFDAALAYPSDNPKLTANRDTMSGKFILRNPAGEELDKTIRTCLTHRSIGYLIELIGSNHESAKQAARALKRHAENHAMKAEIFGWLDAQTKFKSIESAAMAITKQMPIAHVTARDWYKEWKKIRSPGTP